MSVHLQVKKTLKLHAPMKDQWDTTHTGITLVP